MKPEDIGVHTIDQLKARKTHAIHELDKYGIDGKIYCLEKQIERLKDEKRKEQEVLDAMPEMEKEMNCRVWQYAILLDREEVDTPDSAFTTTHCYVVRVYRIPVGVEVSGVNLSYNFNYNRLENVDLIEKEEYYWFIEPFTNKMGREAWRLTDVKMEECVKRAVVAALKYMEKYPTAKVYDMLEDYMYKDSGLKLPEESDRWVK